MSEDAELLHLCAEFMPIAAEENRLCAIYGGLRSCDPGYAEADLALGVAGLKVSVRWEQIAAIPARTPEGVRAKAQVIAAHLPDFDQFIKDGGFFELMAGSLVKDVLARPAP